MKPRGHFFHTGICVLASAWSVVAMLLARPYLLVLPFMIPAQYRTSIAKHNIT